HTMRFSGGRVSMTRHELSRREALKLFGTVAALPSLRTPQSSEMAGSRARRMQWWHAAKFGMFIHWGLYSTYGRHEWVMEMEGIPASEYEKTAKLVNPKPEASRAWATLRKR